MTGKALTSKIMWSESSFGLEFPQTQSFLGPSPTLNSMTMQQLSKAKLQKWQKIKWLVEVELAQKCFSSIVESKTFRVDLCEIQISGTSCLGNNNSTSCKSGPVLLFMLTHLILMWALTHSSHFGRIKTCLRSHNQEMVELVFEPRSWLQKPFIKHSAELSLMRRHPSLPALSNDNSIVGS